MIYFDHNATAPLLPAARDAWLAAADQWMANPSSPHRLGARADAALEDARLRLARLLGCAPAELIWTSGATESVNMVFQHLARTLPSDATLWISAIEHPCALACARHYFARRHRMIPVTPRGVADLEWLERGLAASDDQPPGLVAILAANNETGILQPWREARALCETRNVPFLCDAVQWFGKEPPDGLGRCTFVAGSGHKFGGPKGVGFLKAPASLPWRPLLQGGPQEGGRRAGTENVAGVASMIAAAEARHRLILDGASKPRAAWRRSFETRLLETIPGAALTGGGTAERLWNTVSVILPALPGGQRWVVKLDKHGAAVSTGSACSSGKEEPSHVLAAMGLTPEQSSRVVRLSSGWENDEADWRRLLEILREVWSASVS